MTQRDHLIAAARLGSQAALRKLEQEPECPEEVSYLVDWAYALLGRSGHAMDGTLLPLSYPALLGWAQLMQLELEPLEVQALMELDRVLRNPPPEEPGEGEEQGEGNSLPRKPGGWPTRKTEGEPVLLEG